MGSHREVALHRMIGRNSHVNVTTFTSICLNCRAGNNRAIVSTFECHVILRPVTWITFQVEANCLPFACASEDRQSTALCRVRRNRIRFKTSGFIIRNTSLKRCIRVATRQTIYSDLRNSLRENNAERCALPRARTTVLHLNRNLSWSGRCIQTNALRHAVSILTRASYGLIVIRKLRITETVITIACWIRSQLRNLGTGGVHHFLVCVGAFRIRHNERILQISYTLTVFSNGDI